MFSPQTKSSVFQQSNIISTLTGANGWIINLKKKKKKPESKGKKKNESSKNVEMGGISRASFALAIFKSKSLI